MRFFTALPILSAALSLLSSVAAIPSAAAAAAPAATNGTTHELGERTFYVPPGYELCANVADSYYRGRYDFGCLCISDVDDFARNNNISPTVEGLIRLYIFTHGSLGKYPANAQPTCDGYGGFTCGSLKRVGNKCQATSCPPHLCSSNGGCCPRGQTYHNGQCCATQGCDRSGPRCTPVFDCPKPQFKSNNICCSNAGWVGLETICCPPGQVEKDKMCGCPAGKKKNPRNSNECISSCDKPNWQYSLDKCCPPGSEQSRNGGACVCSDDQKTLSSDGQTCVSKCGSKTNWHFYESKCCPPGATEDAWGNCKCTSLQDELSSDKQSCVPKCGSKTTWTFYQSKCCPPGSAEDRWHNCVCSDSRKELSADKQSCVDKCSVPSWNHCRTKCCPPGSDEDDNKNCVCTDPQQVLSADKQSCVNRCTKSDEVFRDTKCCKKFLVQRGDQCVCPNDSDKIYGNQCVPKCASDENYKPAAYGKPEYCEPKCDEAAGYVFSTSKWNRNGRCCKRGMTACETICCPNGQSEAAPGKCCTIGATWDGHKCVAPTHVPAKKALTGRAERKAQLGFTGMESNKKNELCPVGLAACLIPGTLTNEYECLDAMNDLQSCGGCTSMGTGQDCTAIKGAKWMGCNAGQCEVYSCRAGFKRVGGNKCVAL